MATGYYADIDTGKVYTKKETDSISNLKPLDTTIQFGGATITPTTKVRISSGRRGGGSNNQPSEPPPQPQPEPPPQPAAELNQPPPAVMGLPPSTQPSYFGSNVLDRAESRLRDLAGAGASAAVGTYRWATGADAREREREKNIKEKKQELFEGRREEPFTPSGRGSVVTLFKTYTDEELMEIAKSSTSSNSEAAIQILEERKAKEIAERESIRPTFEAKGKEREKEKELEKYNKEQYEQYEAGNIEYETYVERVGNKQVEVNKALDKEREVIFNKYEADVEKAIVGSDVISDIRKDVKVSRTTDALPLYFAGGVGVAVAAPVVLGTGALAAGVATVGKALFAGYVAMEADTITKELRSGTFDWRDAYSRNAPTVAFAAGAGVTGKVMKAKAGKQVNIEELQTAVGRANYKSKIIKSYTTERQIAALKIDPAQKQILTDVIRQGGVVRSVNYKIVANAKYAGDAAIIKKGMPVQNIKVIEAVSATGKVNGRFQLTQTGTGTVEIGRKGRMVKEDLSFFGQGELTGKKGFIDTVTIADKAVKNPIIKNLNEMVSIGKTRTTFKGKASRIDEATKIRRVSAKGKLFEGGKVVKGSKDLTVSDIKRIELSEINPKAIAKTKFKEIQALTEIGRSGVTSPARAGASAGVELKFTTLKGSGTTTRIDNVLKLNPPKPFKPSSFKPPKPSPFKPPKPVVFKPVKPVKLKSFNVKDSRVISSRNIPESIFQPTNQQNIRNIQSVDLDFSRVPPADFSSTVRDSVSRLATTFKPITYNAPIIKTLDKSRVDFQEKQDNRFVNPVIFAQFSPMKTDTAQPQVDKFVFGTGSTFKYGTTTATKIEEKPVFTFPTIPVTPRIPNIPKIPKIPPFTFPVLARVPRGLTKPKSFNRQFATIKKGYTASIGAAFLGLKRTVTEEEFLKIKKKKYTGFELREQLKIKKGKELNFD